LSDWSSSRELWINKEAVLCWWGKELSLVLLFEEVSLSLNLLLLQFNEVGFSIVSHVPELKVDLSDLTFSKTVRWSVNQVLDGRKLVD
jgi:hypothetical protein